MHSPVPKEMFHEELRLKLRALEKKAIIRHSELSILKGSNWNEDVWLYRGRDSLRLHVGNGSNRELTLLNKVFLVNYLWERRAARKQVSAVRVQELAFPLNSMVSQGSITLLDLDHSAYTKTFHYIRSKYKSPEGNCRSLNFFVRFLFESGLTVQKFDLIGGANLIRKDQHGRVAVESKLPLNSLVKAIIALKWAIQDQQDGTVRSKIDFLAVLTQVFQYGLGLRIGEVLRLPKDCLVYINGEMFCRVWTEKGSEPIARYVPTIWRSALTDAVEKINAICQPYRERAVRFEDGSVLGELDDRFHKRIELVSSNVMSTIERLNVKISTNVTAAEKRLVGLERAPDDAEIELRSLGKYLPFASTAKDASSLVKFYKTNGFNVVSQPIGKVKCRHYVLGKDLNVRMEQLVELRRDVLFYNEFFEVLHGRKPSLGRSKDHSAFNGKLKFRFLTSLELFVLTGERHSQGIRTVLIDSADAAEIARTIAGGGYDLSRYIPVLDAEHLYPEFFNQKTMTSIVGNDSGFYTFLRISETRENFYRPANPRSGLRYRICSGFLIDQSSIKDSVMNTFVSVNSRVSSELVESVKDELLADGIDISSRTFAISQKVSQYLFVVPATLGGVYNEHIPSIFGYHAVMHVIKPTNKGRSAFFRYGVDIDKDLIETFQSHKGRHWQTNSLFRAGLAASIVNKWMGRTDSQGDNYDHQTPRERAGKVGELMLSEQSRFIGDVASKIKRWTQQEVSLENIRSYLDSMLKTVHYGPLGHCLRDINLKPCEFHLKCLTGNSGKGCREFVVDLSDPIQVSQIEAERSRAENELSRLFEALNRPGIPTESVEMHIEHQMTVFRNASYILDRSEIVLTQNQAAQSQDYQPFVHGGSVPDDCVFQCGA